MIVKINPSGTHIQKGMLKVRFDFIPQMYRLNEYDKTYPIHHIESPIVPPGYEGDDVSQFPTEWITNPCLSHFATFSETVTIDDVLDYLDRFITPDDVATVDEIMSYPEPIHYIAPFMRERAKYSLEEVKTRDTVDLINTVNMMIKDITQATSGGKAQKVSPQSILVGETTVSDRGSNITISTVVLARTNAANADGTLDTFNVWLDSGYPADISSGIGTAYTASAYSSRDSEAGGTITAGSAQQVTGLTISVSTGDFLGFHAAGTSTPRLERDASGGLSSTNSVVTFPFTNAAFTDRVWPLSMNATGTEAGGTSIPLFMHHYMGMRQ